MNIVKKKHMNNNIEDLLIVKDNFFSDKIYKEIIYDISNLIFINRANDLTAEDNNPYQKIYFHVPINADHFAVEETRRILKNFGFNLKKGTNSFYFLSTKHEEATPHDDSLVDLNCLIYLKGKDLINSGTGFYDKKENGFVLNRHIGFKENRAIIFDSKIYHASLQFNEGAGTRYVMSNFFNFKEAK